MKKKSSPQKPVWKNPVVVTISIALILVVTVFLVRGGFWGGGSGVPEFRAKGSSQAPVLIMEFSDFQCPNCATAQEELKKVLDRYGENVRFQFHHFPLKMHRWSQMAHRAAESAGTQGTFWAYHDVLFAEQEAWSKSENPQALFVEYAERLGLDLPLFRSGMEGTRHDGAIKKDVNLGNQKKVRSTPTFFINDRRVVGANQLKMYGNRFIQLEIDSQ